MQTNSALGRKACLLNSTNVSLLIVRLNCTLSQCTTIEPCPSCPFLYFTTLPLLLFLFLQLNSSRFFSKRRRRRRRFEYRAIYWKIWTNRVSCTGLGSRTVWRGTLRLDSLYRYPLQRLGANEWSRRKPLVRLAPRTGINWDNSRYLFPSSDTTHPSTVALKTTHFS